MFGFHDNISRGWGIRGPSQRVMYKTVLPAPAHAPVSETTRAASLFSSWGRWCPHEDTVTVTPGEPWAGCNLRVGGVEGHRAGTQVQCWHTNDMGTGALEASSWQARWGIWQRLDSTARTTGTYQFRAATPRWDQKSRALEWALPHPYHLWGLTGSHSAREARDPRCWAVCDLCLLNIWVPRLN